METITETTARLCDVVQLAIVDRVALDDAQRIHRDVCAECRFLIEMSRGFSHVAGGARESGVLGAGIAAALEHASASGEPLFERYRLEALCGRGGQGIVYRALDLETGERVAVKLVRAGAGSAREAGNARRIKHPNVCGVYHTEHRGELRLIVMEWIDGPTLAEHTAAGLGIVRGICAGVAAAHAEGVLHLDLKPSNVLLRDGVPVVTDFGLSMRQAGGDVRALGGTPRYMAPEQLAGDTVDLRSDVYALGRLAEELVARPSRRVRRAIRRATATDRARRFVDAAAFAAALVPVRRRRGTFAMLVAATIAAIAGVLFVVYPVRGPRAIWYPSTWGPDVIPQDAWNVAQNVIGEGLPRVEVNDPMFACGQRPYDLLDGIAQYSNWEHGVAFRPAPSPQHPGHACIALNWLGACGTLADDEPLCEFDGSTAGFHLYPARGRDLAAIPPAMRARLGQAVTTVPCGERPLIVHLDDVYPVFAVRAWHRGAINVPHRFRIELHDEHGGVRIEAATQNVQGTHGVDHEIGSEMATSAPVTTQFAPILTREIHYVIDTCSTLDPPGFIDPRGDAHEVAGTGAPSHGWLYEIEVFAMLPRWQAWGRFLRGR